MAVKSYLAFSAPGRFSSMLTRLGDFAACEVYPASDREVAILVTDTESEADEKELCARLEREPALMCLALVYAHAG